MFFNIQSFKLKVSYRLLLARSKSQFELHRHIDTILTFLAITQKYTKWTLSRK